MTKAQSVSETFDAGALLTTNRLSPTVLSDRKSKYFGSNITMNITSDDIISAANFRISVDRSPTHPQKSTRQFVYMLHSSVCANTSLKKKANEELAD